MIRTSLDIVSSNETDNEAGYKGLLIAVIELAVRDYRKNLVYKDSSHRLFNEHLYTSSLRFLTGNLFILYLDMLDVQYPEQFRKRLLKDLKIL